MFNVVHSIDTLFSIYKPKLQQHGSLNRETAIKVEEKLSACSTILYDVSTWKIG